MRRFVFILGIFLVSLGTLALLLFLRCDSDWCLVTQARRVRATTTYHECFRRGFSIVQSPVPLCTLPSGKAFSASGSALYYRSLLPFSFSYPSTWNQQRHFLPMLDTLSGSGGSVTLSLLSSDENQESVLDSLILITPSLGNSPTIVRGSIDATHRVSLAVPWPSRLSSSGAVIALIQLQPPLFIHTTGYRYIVVNASSESVMQTLLNSFSFLPGQQLVSRSFLDSLFHQ